MKITFIISSIGPGGAERVCCNLASYLAASGYAVTIVSLGYPEQDAYEVHKSVSLIHLRVTGIAGGFFNGLLNNLRRVLAVKEVILKIRPDICIGMMANTSVLLGICAIGDTKTLYFGTEHTYPPNFPLGRIWNLLRKVLYYNLDAVVSLTVKGSNWVRLHTFAKRSLVIPNAVRMPLPIQRPITDVTPYFSDGRNVVLCVGRLVPEKQFDLIVSAFASIHLHFISWKLLIVGDGPLHDDLRLQINDLSASSYITLAGRVGNVGEFYERSSLFVLSSRFEGFPNVLTEAMAHGLPVISFDCDTGPRDIIRDKIDGILVRLNDIEGLKTALLEMMGCETTRRKMGHSAKDVLKRFSEASVAEKWETLFRSKNLP